MTATTKQDLLRKLPSVSDLLESEAVSPLIDEYPRGLVTDCLRDAIEEVRRRIMAGSDEQCDAATVCQDQIVIAARENLERLTTPHLRRAINATGIILHTGLGRAAWPETVVDSIAEGLKGYVTLAIDRETGKRSERDRRVEYMLTELTGAEAATVVNNNAAGTMLALAALSPEKEVIISRGQLVEIGGSFRLPDVMAISRAKMVEVGTTNRTHLRDYANAITDNTAIICRAHPSNYRVVGFTKEAALAELVELAHSRGLVVVDDLGAGALLDMEQFSLPHEPTMRESIDAGADVVLASADKLIGAAQGGVIVGSRECIDKIRKHPLARAFRADKACLMVLERTLHLFRDVEVLKREHPTYRMLVTSPEVLLERATSLQKAIDEVPGQCTTEIIDGIGFLGSGSLPMEELKTSLVAVTAPSLSCDKLARALRIDEACIFARIQDDKVVFDVRTITDDQVAPIAAAVSRAAGGAS